VRRRVVPRAGARPVRRERPADSIHPRPGGGRAGRRDPGRRVPPGGPARAASRDGFPRGALGSRVECVFY